MKKNINGDKLNKHTSNDTPMQGVGDRHIKTDSHLLGGGYLENCTASNFQKKIAQNDFEKIKEIEQIGLARHWINIAKEIGVDQFLIIWRILSNDDLAANDKNYVYIPRFTVFKRFQRNRVILTLHSDGKNTKDIQKIIKSDLKETVTIGHIKRIIDSTSK